MGCYTVNIQHLNVCTTPNGKSVKVQYAWVASFYIKLTAVTRNLIAVN